MDKIQREIIERLSMIESEHQVKIPIAVESGSRSWGFASPDSDYDCRFIYVRPEDFYLSVFAHKDTIDYVPDAVFDINGWDLKKVILHLVKSNAVMLEWLQSNDIYRRNEDVAAELWELGRKFFNQLHVSHHYLSLARHMLSEVLQGETAKIKRYCYILRPLSCIRFIYEHEDIPFMEYRRNLEAISVPGDVLREIDELLQAKAQAGEAQEIKQNKLLLDYFAEEIAKTEEWLSCAEFEKNRNCDTADQTFRKIIKMVNADGKY